MWFSNRGFLSVSSVSSASCRHWLASTPYRRLVPEASAALLICWHSSAFARHRSDRDDIKPSPVHISDMRTQRAALKRRHCGCPRSPRSKMICRDIFATWVPGNFRPFAPDQLVNNQNVTLRAFHAARTHCLLPSINKGAGPLRPRPRSAAGGACAVCCG